MNLEELKLILDTVRGISGDVQVVAILWLVLTELLPTMTGLTAFWLFFRFARAVVNDALAGNRSEAALKDLRDLLGIGRLGPLLPQEREEVLRTVRRLHQAEQERKAEQKRRAEDLKPFTTPRGDSL